MGQERSRRHWYWLLLIPLLGLLIPADYEAERGEPALETLPATPQQETEREPEREPEPARR